MIHHKIEPTVAEGIIERKRDYWIVAVTVSVSALYATLRYNVFKGVPWSDWPHYIGNKILALSSLILIAIAVRRLVADYPHPIRRLMAVGSAFAFTHTLVSLGLFKPVYFDKFFAGEKLSLSGGASLIIASLAIALLNWGKGRPGSLAPRGAILPLGTVAFLSGVHAALPSVTSWLEPDSWPGRMPPITLISFVLGSGALICALWVEAVPLQVDRASAKMLAGSAERPEIPTRTREN